MELVISKDQCCGCTACENICPKDAIIMAEDECGFKYPQIDDEKCINCGLCKKVCGFNENYSKDGLLEKVKVYGAKYNNDDVRMKSSSGGVYTALSDYVLSKGGVVYGAEYDDNFKVCHTRATTKGERDKQRGSKYVQSDLGNIFSEVKKDLLEDKYVLFSGTPCQVAGLQGFLGKAYDKLIKCDLVCHAAPSPKVFKEYISYLEDKYKSKVKSYTFREKGKGTISQIIKAEMINGKIHRRGDLALDPFGYLFARSKIVRPSCFNCQYTNLQRPADITLADFWGIEKAIPEFVDNTGTSLVLVNTNKGEEVFKEISKDIRYKESSIDKCPHFNLRRPVKKPADYDKVWEDYKANGFKFIAKKHGGDNIVDYTKIRCKRIIKSIIKR